MWILAIELWTITARILTSLCPHWDGRCWEASSSPPGSSFSSLSLSASSLPSFLLAGLEKSIPEDVLIEQKKEREYQRGNKVWSHFLLIQVQTHIFMISLQILSFISAMLVCFINSEEFNKQFSCVFVCDDWPSVGHHHTVESCLSEPSSSWRPHRASSVPPPAPSSPFLPAVQIVQDGHTGERHTPPVHLVPPTAEPILTAVKMFSLFAMFENGSGLHVDFKFNLQ